MIDSRPNEVHSSPAYALYIEEAFTAYAVGRIRANDEPLWRRLPQSRRFMQNCFARGISGKDRSSVFREVRQGNHDPDRH